MIFSRAQGGKDRLLPSNVLWREALALLAGAPSLMIIHVPAAFTA
jgi:hypothetical protein